MLADDFTKDNRQTATLLHTTVVTGMHSRPEKTLTNMGLCIREPIKEPFSILATSDPISAKEGCGELAVRSFHKLFACHWKYSYLQALRISPFLGMNPPKPLQHPRR